MMYKSRIGGRRWCLIKMHLIKMQWQNQQQLQLQLVVKHLRRNPVCFSIEKVADEKPQDRPKNQATRRQNTKNEECRIWWIWNLQLDFDFDCCVVLCCAFATISLRCRNCCTNPSEPHPHPHPHPHPAKRTNPSWPAKNVINKLLSNIHWRAK